ncbi:DUF6493 family protein [Catenulispora rubra]|uniref:DUF6493 family protein n=1 Tax=Catenulispora rubra TaxID=280293 RepID=UPI0018925B9A|nr:DUF6493 family protein [Catenulispora rubra]
MIWRRAAAKGAAEAAEAVGAPEVAAAGAAAGSASVSASSSASASVSASIPDFTSRLASGDAASVADFFQGMSEKDRRTFGKPLREFLRTVRWGSSTDDEDWRTFMERRNHAERTVIPAALAVFASASATAKFLRGVQRTDLFHPRETDAVRQVLTERSPAWLTELPAALLAELEPERAYQLVQVVAAVAGVELEATPDFVRAWGSDYTWGRNGEQLKAEILADPRLGELLPLLFDDDENDQMFKPRAAFRVAAVTAVQRAQVPRAAVLDGSLRRLLRGGRPGALQDHLAFWNGLEATDDEVVERVSSCISLLSSQSGTVARTFLAALRKASDVGLLDVELAVEAASIAVTRSEKNVVKTTLSWLDTLLVAHPDRAGQLVDAVGTAFGAQAADLQERAVKLAGKHAKKSGEDERGRLVAEAQVYLAPDLVATLAGLLGVSQDSSTDNAGDIAGVGYPGYPGHPGYPEVAPYVPRPLLPPIGSPAELAEVVASLMHADPVEAMVFERVLEAVVEFERTDSAGLREALAPIVERWSSASGQVGTSGMGALTPRSALCMVVAAGARAGEEARRHPHRASVKQLWSRARKSSRGWYRRRRTTPADFLTLRAAEIHAALGMAEMPPLVSMPTSPTGAIEPEVLAARLRQCEARGWVPLEADFHQALLRLPADCGGVDVSGLTSKAGRRFAAWVAGERVVLPPASLPEPAAREAVRNLPDAELARRVAQGHAVAPETLLDLAPGVWREPERCWNESDWTTCWPAIIPSRPDLSALAMLGGVDWGTAPPSPESAVVLAEQDGPQDGTHKVIAYRLVSDDVRLRASGVDAALVLASRKLLDPAALGPALAAELRAFPASGVRRAVPALRDLANGGAPAEAWEAIALILPQVLPPAVPKTLSGTADLLALATELAGALPAARTPIAEVTALAQKKSGGAVGNAARRLEAVLRAG